MSRNILYSDFRNHRPMFYQKVIDPFVAPFIDFFLIKVSLFTGIVLAQVTGILDMFSTPKGYYYTLIGLIIADAVSKSVRVYFIEKGGWDFDLFIRKSLYKCTVYFVICMSFTMFSNQWEGGSNSIQYAAYMGLSVLELFSIALHHKLLGYLIAVFKQIASGKINAEKLKEEAKRFSVKKSSEGSNN